VSATAVDLCQPLPHAAAAVAAADGHLSSHGAVRRTQAATVADRPDAEERRAALAAVAVGVASLQSEMAGRIRALQPERCSHVQRSLCCVVQEAGGGARLRAAYDCR
jgi:hypothetical protein